MSEVIAAVFREILRWAATPEGTLAVLGWIGAAGYGLRLLFARIAAKRGEKVLRALGFVERGVATAYSEYVEKIKAASADGSISPEERREAKNRAISSAVSTARAEGLDLLRTVGQEHLSGMVDHAVARAKGRLLPARIEALLGKIR